MDIYDEQYRMWNWKIMCYESVQNAIKEGDTLFITKHKKWAEAMCDFCGVDFEDIKKKILDHRDPFLDSVLEEDRKEIREAMSESTTHDKHELYEVLKRMCEKYTCSQISRVMNISSECLYKRLRQKGLPPRQMTKEERRLYFEQIYFEKISK